MPKESDPRNESQEKQFAREIEGMHLKPGVEYKAVLGENQDGYAHVVDIVRANELGPGGSTIADGTLTPRFIKDREDNEAEAAREIAEKILAERK